MHPLLLRTRARIRDAAKPLAEAAVGGLTIAMLRTTRYFDPIKTANLFGRITRAIGPMMREQRIGRANLTAAFPEKSPEEIETILAGVWDNLGRRRGRSDHFAADARAPADSADHQLRYSGSCDSLRRGAERRPRCARYRGDVEVVRVRWPECLADSGA